MPLAWDCNSMPTVPRGRMVKARKSIIKSAPKSQINAQEPKQEITRYFPVLINADYQFLPVKPGLSPPEYEAITGLVNGTVHTEF